MSTRTIIEIDHDHLHALQWDGEFWTNLLTRLASAHYVGDIIELNESGKPVSIGHGVRIVTQRHHSDALTVKTRSAEVKL